MTSRVDILAWINTRRASDDPEVDVEMYQSVLILPLFWNVPTLPLSEVTEREVTRNCEISLPIL